MASIVLAFNYETNRRAAATQDYELAKAHYTEVCRTLDYTQSEHVAMFHAAFDRMAQARQRWLECVTGR